MSDTFAAVPSWSMVVSPRSLLEKVLVVIGVCLLQVCHCGVIRTHGRAEEATDVEISNIDEFRMHGDYIGQPYMEVYMQSVPVKYFEQKLIEAKSYHDVLRIFYGDILTDHVIDSMITSQPHTQFHGKALGRPRIGGLSDTKTFVMENPSIEELKRATKHAQEMEVRTRCHDPVPVVVRIRDISTAATKEYFPHCTIVYRCRADAGCCNETSVCASKENTTISRAFFALEYEKNGDMVAPSRKIIESFTFVNHTQCECRPVPQLPQCLECPHPFSLRRENKTDCSCDCFDGDQTCIKVKKGRQALHEHQLRCIKENKCHRPKCQYGIFDQESIKTGYCPKHRHYEDDASGSPDVAVSKRRRGQ